MDFFLGDRNVRFLMVEDNRDLAETVQARLSIDGHAVDWAQDISDANDHLAVANYDLILLDIMLPDGDGRDFLAAHRKAKRDTPVIVMTARSAVSDRVAMLDTGADDYITKPFDFMELSARVRAVLRRRHGRSETSHVFGDVSFDPLSATVSFGQVTHELRNRELRLLEVFFSATDRIFSKAQLYDRLFASSELVNDNAIEVYVGRLRKKLEGSSVKIETVRGIGYRLTTE